MVSKFSSLFCFIKTFILFTFIISVIAPSCRGNILDQVEYEGKGNHTELETFSHKWRTEVQEAVVNAGAQLQKNIMLTLSTLLMRGFGISRTGKHLLMRLIIAIIEHSFNFARMVGSLPKILVEDFPTQFIQVLRIMRKEPGLSKALTDTIDGLINIIEATQASGVSQLIFKPVTRVIPNLLTGVSRFLVVIFDGVFYLIGARDHYGLFLTTTTTSNPMIVSQLNNTTLLITS